LARTGRGSGIKVSLFDSAAGLMAVPYLQARYGDGAPDRVGLKHPSIAPYGAFTCSDGREIVLSIQNEREWASFCQRVLLRPDIATDVRFTSNNVRTSNRVELESLIRDVFAELTYAQAVDRLTDAQTEYGAINSVRDLIRHPQLRTRPMKVRGLDAEIPATPYATEWDEACYPQAPAVDQHGEALRREFEPVRVDLRAGRMKRSVDKLEAFRAQALAEGFDEVLDRVWAPGLEIENPQPSVRRRGGRHPGRNVADVCWRDPTPGAWRHLR
ncbi:MAG: CoA transferase, partial [Variovorax sp.]